MPDYGMQKQMNVGGLSRVLVTVLVLVLLFFMGACSITKVDTGNVGVLTKFGRVTGDVLPEGIHMVDPLKASNQLSVRTQEQKETASVPSSEGLIMTLEASLLSALAVTPQQLYSGICPKDPEPACADRNTWTTAGAISIPAFPFQNRPTFQQVVTLTRTLPR